MASITVYIDDSAEERRRRRLRWTKLGFVLVLLPFAPLLSRTKTETRVVVRTDTVYVERTVMHVQACDTYGPLLPRRHDKPAAPTLARAPLLIRIKQPQSPSWPAGPAITRQTSTTHCPSNIQARIEPAHIHFTGVGSRPVTVFNPHPCPVFVTDIRVDAGYDLEYEDRCTKTLQPGEHCTFKVRTTKPYTPRARVNVTSAAGTGHARH